VFILHNKTFVMTDIWCSILTDMCMYQPIRTTTVNMAHAHRLRIV